jgi:hypothetical protein
MPAKSQRPVLRKWPGDGSANEPCYYQSRSKFLKGALLDKRLCIRCWEAYPTRYLLRGNRESSLTAR